jgi:hypothetical protein
MPEGAQAGVGALQIVEHVPQCAGVVKSVSQPSAGFAEQWPKPWMQVKEQTPPEQVGDATCGSCVQSLLHEPHVWGSAGDTQPEAQTSCPTEHPLGESAEPSGIPASGVALSGMGALSVMGALSGVGAPSGFEPSWDVASTPGGASGCVASADPSTGSGTSLAASMPKNWAQPAEPSAAAAKSQGTSDRLIRTCPRGATLARQTPPRRRSSTRAS